MLFDTHTHFDVPDFDQDREQLAKQAKAKGIEALILIGFVQDRFTDLIQTHHFLNTLANAPKSLLAPGLHPFYIEQHTSNHLNALEKILQQEQCIAIGEIGLDNFLIQHKVEAVFEKQQDFFKQQIELAKHYNKPVLLHIRKSHADVLKILKAHKFKQGGIAHAFSGGIQEAIAFVQLGFKIGVTGQITNLNTKKLHDVVKAVGLENLVIETDCPDMTPLCCQTSTAERTRNTPVNLPYVLQGLAEVLNLPLNHVEKAVWKNSLEALHLNANFP